MKKLINIPSNDLRKYGYGILENKVKYVLVNDDKIDVSSVCVAVKTGSINDPIKYKPWVINWLLKIWLVGLLVIWAIFKIVKHSAKPEIIKIFNEPK